MLRRWESETLNKLKMVINHKVNNVNYHHKMIRELTYLTSLAPRQLVNQIHVIHRDKGLKLQNVDSLILSIVAN